MREIKFRVWTPRLKRFACFEINPMNGFSKEFHETFEKDIDKNSILMQYTGIKDTNGKEIYERDIVVIKSEKSISIVYVSIDEKYGFIWNGFSSEKSKDSALSNINEVPNLYFFDDLPTRYNFSNHRLTNVEVVGNLLENPDLVQNLWHKEKHK